MTNDKRSLAAQVRTELLAIEENVRHYPAFLSGAIRGLGELEFTFKGFALSFRHTDRALIEKLCRLVSVVTGEEASYYETHLESALNEGDYFVLNLPVETAKDLLDRCAIVKNRVEIVDVLPDELFVDEDGKRAYLRGLFLSCGYLGAPEEINEWVPAKTKGGGYSMEFNLNSSVVLEPIKDLIVSEAQLPEGIVRVRPRTSVVYVRTAEAVETILAAMGSIGGVLALNEIIMERAVKNDVNRAANCVVANIDKIVLANEKQVADVLLIQKTMGFDTLSEPLKQTCELRLAHPDLGLAALGESFTPPVGKSCVNHRFRKIAEIADAIRRSK